MIVGFAYNVENIVVANENRIEGKIVRMENRKRINSIVFQFLEMHFICFG